MKRFSVLLLSTIIATTIFYGCDEKKPEKYGIFVKTNKKTVEIYKINKTPNTVDVDPEVIKAYNMALKEDQKFNDYLYRVVERDRKDYLEAMSSLGGTVPAEFKVETPHVKSFLLDIENIYKQPVFEKVSLISIRDTQAQKFKIWYSPSLSLHNDSLVETTDFQIGNRDIDWVVCEPIGELKQGQYCIYFTRQKPTSWDQLKSSYIFRIGTNKVILEDLNITKSKAYAKILKLNMSEARRCVEQWSTEADGKYPSTLEQPVGRKNKFVLQIAQDKIENPYNATTPAMVLSLSDPPVWENINAGQVVYVPLFKKKVVIGYKIYGKSDSGPLSLVLKSGE